TSASPAYQAVASQYFPYLLENKQTQANNFKFYSKRQEDKDKVVADDHLHYHASPANPGAFESLAKVKLPFKIDSLIEFPFGGKADLAAVCDREGQVVFVRADFKIKNSKNQLESCISINNRENNEALSYTSKSGIDFVPANDSTMTLITDLFVGTIFKEAHGKSDLSCYLWNRGKENLVLTGYEIKVIDYWQNKWHFWD
ncbi:MAG: hypothetical protein JNL60_13905, partial [Bacteroidia bacterium]|nr:hypothetical protein [Bacteroidia bacterium]